MMPGVRTARFALAVVAGVLALLGPSPTAQAQEIEPRAYSNIPVGLNFMALGYVHSQGDLSFDASVPIEDVHLRIDGTFLAYVRSFGFFGRSASVAVAFPYAWLAGEATFRGERVERKVDGLADPKVRLTVNVYGAPALTVEEFPEYKQNLVVGVSVAVSAPLGQYDSRHLLNVGTNRWAVKPEVGLSKAWGPLILEAAAGVTFYTPNNDFLRGRKLERAPVYSLQAHLIYNLPHGIWAALDTVGYRGGRITLDGVEGEALQENLRVGLTFSFPVTRHSSIKITGSTGAYARFGGNFNTGAIAWQVGW
jgi:hypothetical protein